MADPTNNYWDCKQEQDLFHPQQLQLHQQYQYPSTDLQPSQTLSLDYYSTGVNQAPIYPAGTETMAYDTDVSMLYGNPHSDSYVRLAGPYGPQKTSLSEYTDITSFPNINTPNPMTDGSCSGYVMVPNNRRYSDNSNRTSGQGSDSPLYSTPGDQESPWYHGSAFAVDRDGMQEEDVMSSMPHDQKCVLAGLSSPEPRTVPNPYEPVNTVEGVIYQETMVDYQMSPSHQQSFVLPSQSAHCHGQDVCDDPWNHVKKRVPAYPAGFTGFAPSPGPMVDFCAGYEGASVATSPETSKSSLNLNKRSRSERTPSTKGKEIDHSAGWEHTVINRGGLCRVSEIPEEAARKKGGKRTGGLDPETKEKARRIRQMRACWNCWVQKVPCSEGKTCLRCQSLSRKQFSPSAHQLCCRSGFKDYESTLFPEFMHAHLKKSKIEDMITEHTIRFLDNVILVEVSTGAVFRPMRLTTNVFEPKTSELIVQSSLTSAEPDQAWQLVRQSSAPVGILGVSVSDLKKKCDKHIEEMIRNSEYVKQVTSGDMSQLPQQILEIVCEYSAKKEIPVLRKALKLHAIHYFMGRLVTFSESSKNEIYNKVGPTLIPQSYLSSRLLNRQIKYAMHKIHHEITAQVLEELERSLRTRTKDSWGPSFCAILLLCLCIENLQSAADIMVVCNIQEKGDEASYRHDQSWGACQELDEYPFKQCKKLFHDIYKSHKDRNSGGRGEKAFNPLMTAVENETGLDSATENMVIKIYSIICDYWSEIMDLSEKPPFVNFGYPVDANDIKANNTGRLAAKFLKSFFVQDD